MDDKQLEQYGIELAKAAFNARGQLATSLATMPHVKNVQSYEQLPGMVQAAFRVMALAVARRVGELGMVPPPRRATPHQESVPRGKGSAAGPAQVTDFESPSLAKTAPAPAPAAPAPPAPQRPVIVERVEEILAITRRLADAVAALEERVRVLEGVNQVVHPEVVLLKPGPEGDGAPTATDFAG